MDYNSESTSSTSTDCYQVFNNPKLAPVPPLITVKFTTEDGKVFTQAYTQKINLYEIKDVLAEVFAISKDKIGIMLGDEHIADDRHIGSFEVNEFKVLEFTLVSLDSKHIISAEDAYKDFAEPDILTVRIDDSEEEEGYRDVVVEIEDRSIIKPYLGGYVSNKSGVEYHHGYTQTGPRKPRIPPERRNHRDTQTYWLRNRSLDTDYEHATQMANEDIYIPTVTDKIVTAGPYKTAAEWEAGRDLLNKILTIQRYFRAWKMRKAVKVLSAEYRKRVALQLEADEYDKKDEVDRKKRELICKIFPRTKADFCILYALVEQWKRAEIKRICDSSIGSARMAAFYMLLEKEVKMLQEIEKHREVIKKDMRIQKEVEFLKTIGDPLKWNSHYKNLEIEMDTLETQKGKQFRDIYLSLCDESASTEVRLQDLLNVKLLLKDHTCRLSNDLIVLVDRACDLLVRGIDNRHLDILMKRIQSLFMQHVKHPECSFGVTNRSIRVKEKLMHDNLFYCSRCQKLKTYEQFPIGHHINKLTVCTICSWDDRTLEPWIDLSPYQFMLRSIRREEQRKKSVSSVVFIITARDIHYIVMTIWQGHSAITERTDVYNLRLVRWFKDEDWAPWNCVLLTPEEAKAHVEIEKLTDVYDLHFICRVFNKNALAKQHFKNVLKIDGSLQEFRTIDTKWNEIKKFVEFVAVNSKTKIFLSCH